MPRCRTAKSGAVICEIEGLEELATEQLRDMQLLGVCEAMRKASK